MIFAPSSPTDWRPFIHEQLPQLKAKGWQVTVEDDFTRNVTDIEGIDGQVVQGNDGWFNVDLTVNVGQRQVRMQPLLAGCFNRIAAG